PADHFYESPSEGQPEAVPSITPSIKIIPFRKGLKDSRLIFLLHPNSYVYHREMQLNHASFERKRFDAQPNFAALGKFDRVPHQVCDDLPQPGRVTVDDFRHFSLYIA